MSFSTEQAKSGERPASRLGVVLKLVRKSRHSRDMDTLFRLTNIARNKYVQNPNDREPAVRMMLRNTLRLAILHLGRGVVEDIARQTLQEPQQ